MCISTRSFFNLFVLIVLGAALGSTTSFGQTITGTVYRDFNGDGAYTSIPVSGTYAYGEPGVSGMTVTAYSSNSATAPVSTTTNANGSYTLTVGSTSQFRVEFTNLVAGDYESFRGTGSATSVQFVNGGSTSVNLGVNYPANYCQSTTPELVTTCFISINATNNPTLQSRPVLVGVPYTVDDDTKTVTDYATEGEIGAAWGVAYKKDTKQLFESAFTKRHVGFSAGGPNAIYITNITSTTAGNTTEFFNFTTVGGTAVTSTTETHGTDLPTGLSGSSTSNQLASHDNVAFDAVGKTSLGDIEMSDDGKTLYVVNLKDRKLYSIDVATKVATGVAIPNPGCTTSSTVVNGSYRPFALKYYRGLIYVGVVCTREDLGSTTVAYGSTPGLSSTVYAVDPAALSTFTTVLSFPLTYKKQPSDADKTGQAAAEYWRPWTSVFQADRSDGPYSYPQAWLTGIEFEPGTGDMILGLRDRFGDQIGYQNYVPFSTGTTLISAISPGEILRARKCNTTDVTWTLESGGALCSTPASATQAAQQGPDNGKYYWGDRVQNGANHGMSSQGALAQLGGSEDVAMTAIDPTDVFNTGGIKRLHNDTGAKDGNATGTAANPGAGAELYGSDAFGYGKANGLGDLEVLCNLAPVEIGNRVWVDANNNGIQDPGELPLAGVKVTLTGPGITGSVSVTTNAAGEYYFSSATSGTAATGFAYSLTGLTSGGSYSLTFPTSASAGALTLSNKPNSATGTNADNIDTDPNSAGVISFTLGQAGQNNFSYDAGYVPPASLGDYVFEDKNANGIQDAGDTPIAGVKVTLYTNGVASATTVTNASGLYSFTGLTPGSSLSYSVGFTAPAGYTATQANIGNDDTKDSDGNPSTGLTGVYSLTAGEYNPTIDMGYVKPASLGDYVFVDANKDGIQDTGDTPIPGVVVTLYTNGVASATTVTDASGLYSFTGLTPGTNLSYSVGFATPAGYTATTPLSGTDKTKDSDADLITGKTQSITLASGENNPTLDAGFYLLPAGLGDYVFLDANKDGIQNTGDTPIAGVTVTLYTNGVASATTLTNASGLYSFTGLTPGSSNSYVVGFTAPAGMTATLANAGSDDTKDSDADPITGKTQSVTLAPNEFNPTLDAGFYIPSAGLGDYVFLDANKDGIQNTGDTPIAGVTVTLYTNGVASATTLTNASGLYSFTGLTPGTSNSYVVGFTAPAGMTATLANAGSDDTKDSDADPITGKTQSVTLAPGEFNPTLDAGFFTPKAKSPKLTITKQVDKSKAKLHDVLTYTLTIDNSGDAEATNLFLRDSTTTGLTYVANSATNPAGTTFTQGTPISIWTIASLTPGQSLSMTFQATADSTGILYNKATLAGDTATVCTSIPVVMCAGDVYSFQLTAPAGRSSYQWFKDGLPISGQTTHVLEVTAPGTYSLAVDNTSGKCPDFSCCPFIIEQDSLPSFSAKAVPVTCTGSTPLANGQIVLSGFNPASSYQYSAGASFTAGASLSGVAKTIPGDGLLVGTLANPSVATAYTIRVYNASGCYTDVTVLLMPTVCGCPADICVPFVLSQAKRAPRIGDPK